MKRIFITLGCFIGMLVHVQPVSAQQDVMAEGFASIASVSDAVARQTLTSLRQQNPAATLEEARISIARRTARMDAIRNVAEYVHGIQFEYSQGSFAPKMTLRTEGDVDIGAATFRQLESGLVVASMRLPLPEEQRAVRRGLKTYEVTGVAPGTDEDNPLKIMRNARADALMKAVQQAISERMPGAAESGATVRGTLYIVETVGDEPGEPYRLTMRLQVLLEMPRSGHVLHDRLIQVDS